MGLRRPIAVLLSGAVLSALAAGCGITEDEPDLVAGKSAFAEKCGSCHVLARAGTQGIQGPNLDEAFRQALADGLERDGIEGAVLEQIDNPAMVAKDSPAYMPPDLVTDRDAENVEAAQAVRPWPRCRNDAGGGGRRPAPTSRPAPPSSPRPKRARRWRISLPQMR